MAAYAALVSLMNTMNQIMNHPRLSTCLDKQQTQSVAQKLGSLLEFTEKYNSHGGDEEVECLERRIASAAHTAEDVMESLTVDQIHAGILENAPSNLIDLQQIVQGIDHIEEEVAQFEEKCGTKNKKRKYSSAPASSEPLTTGKTTVVGFDGYLNRLLDSLTGLESHRQVIPIVGMGGIGKTTLARYTYENLIIAHYFHVRAWVSISQHYNVKKIFVELLSSLGQSMDKDDKQKLEQNNEDELSERLYKFLCGRRYLIVLDDMWSFTVWERIRFYFPEDYNSSRILVTTRILQVANHFGSSRVLVMELLDDNKSWDLFCDKAFRQQASGCPAELEQIGKTIVKKCKGLPLSIVVIGALLGKSSWSKEYWENVVEDINSSHLNSAQDNQCYNILYLSYNHLPARLKPCFLYLGIFPEDHEMEVSRLIKLWAAEGFIKPDKDRSLEEVAEGYMNDLFGRNLILVGRLGWNMTCETFYIHDLLRDLCLREAQKEKFFCVMRGLKTPQGMDRERRIVVRQETEEEYSHQDFDSLKSTSTARSLIGEWGQQLFQCRLLRVLVADYDDHRNYFPGVCFEQVNMRLLHHKSVVPMVTLKGIRELPRSVSLLWNLQTLILVFDGIVEAPPEIWKLRQLRHLEFWMVTLSDPPTSDDEVDDFVLHNLHTLMRVLKFKCSEEVCKRIPNIKRLQVCYYDEFSEDESCSEYCLENVGHLNKLESLSYEFSVAPHRDHLVQNLKFPTSLKELFLWNCGLDWDDLRIIGWLPNLEFLKLRLNSFKGEEWNSVEGEFLRLKYLEIDSCGDLKKWNADDNSHFPVLEALVVSFLYHLEEIPSGIGEIPTLRSIRGERCTISAAFSAMKILEEQESLGNDGLQILLQFREKTEMENFIELVEMEDITCTNFKLNYAA